MNFWTFLDRTAARLFDEPGCVIILLFLVCALGFGASRCTSSYGTQGCTIRFGGAPTLDAGAP